jgi:hypothetical protein
MTVEINIVCIVFLVLIGTLSALGIISFNNPTKPRLSKAERAALDELKKDLKKPMHFGAIIIAPGTMNAGAMVITYMIVGHNPVGHVINSDHQHLFLNSAADVLTAQGWHIERNEQNRQVWTLARDAYRLPASQPSTLSLYA